MPWKESGVLEERFRFMEEWSSEDWSMAELCRYFGVTRKTGYKWLERYQEGGMDGLRERSRAPHTHPNAVEEQTERRVIAARERHPLWGARKIHALLEQEEDEPTTVPAVSTIGSILKANGLTLPRKRRPQARPSQTPLAHATEANKVWCADFKGWFRSADGERIDPLTISDAYSRYLLRCQAVKTTDYVSSKPIFEAAFREYGLPERIRTDNGAPFGSNGESGLTGLSVWWIQLGIQPERIQPGHPQQNGRHERMHRTLKQATASPPAGNRRAQQQRFDQFRREYNEQRPHEALGQATPASYYGPSARAYPRRVAEVEYPESWQVRRVSPGGQIRWQCHHVFVSHALCAHAVGLEPIAEGHWRVWFSFYDVGVLDARQGRIWRPEQWDKQQRRQQRKVCAGTSENA
jgi:transposase InsO family protein